MLLIFNYYWCDGAINIPHDGYLIEADSDAQNGIMVSNVSIFESEYIMKYTYTRTLFSRKKKIYNINTCAECIVSFIPP